MAQTAINILLAVWMIGIGGILFASNYVEDKHLLKICTNIVFTICLMHTISTVFLLLIL